MKEMNIYRSKIRTTLRELLRRGDFVREKQIVYDGLFLHIRIPSVDKGRASFCPRRVESCDNYVRNKVVSREKGRYNKGEYYKRFMQS